MGQEQHGLRRGVQERNAVLHRHHAAAPGPPPARLPLPLHPGAYLRQRLRGPRLHAAAGGRRAPAGPPGVQRHPVGQAEEAAAAESQRRAAARPPEPRPHRASAQRQDGQRGPASGAPPGHAHAQDRHPNAQGRDHRHGASAEPGGLAGVDRQRHNMRDGLG